MFKKENKTLEILLKVFLAVGIVAGICIIVKILYDKYKKKFDSLCDDEYDCNLECLEDDGLACDCDNCQYAQPAEPVDEVVEAEVMPEEA